MPWKDRGRSPTGEPLSARRPVTIRWRSRRRRCERSATARSTRSSSSSPIRRRRRCGVRPRGTGGADRRGRSGAPAAAGTSCSRDARPERAALHESSRAPALLRVHPRVVHVPGGARRPDRRARSTSMSAAGASAAGPSRLELVVLDWFKQWIGYPDRRPRGVLVSGGSAANVTALACARETLVGAGLRPRGHLRLRSDPLVGRAGGPAARVRVASESAASRPTTGTGCVSTRWSGRSTEDTRAGPAAADRRRQRGRDEHRRDRSAPGARGDLRASAACGCTSTPPTAGSRRSPSAGASCSPVSSSPTRSTLDPHKWLYQPIECGCVLVRDGALLERAFAIAPDYLDDYRGDEVDFCDRGLQLTRSARALKVWLSLSYFGVDAFTEAIDRALDLARLAAAADRPGSRPRAPLSRDARRRVLPPTPRRHARRARARAHQLTSSWPRSKRPGAGSCPRRGSTVATRSACA